MTQTMAMAQLTESGSPRVEAARPMQGSARTRRDASRRASISVPACGRVLLHVRGDGRDAGKTTFEKRLFEQRGTRRGRSSLQIEVRNPIARCVSPGAGPHGVCIVAHEACMSAAAHHRRGCA